MCNNEQYKIVIIFKGIFPRNYVEIHTGYISSFLANMLTSKHGKVGSAVMCKWTDTSNVKFLKLLKAFIKSTYTHYNLFILY